jgi:hypothetical protein
LGGLLQQPPFFSFFFGADAGAEAGVALGFCAVVVAVVLAGSAAYTALADKTRKVDAARASSLFIAISPGG